jgi:hypothetical protein
MRYLIAKIGTCGFCIRSAFRAALAASAIASLTFLIHSIVLTAVAVVCGVGLCLLWLLHVIVFGLRTAHRRAADQASEIQSRRRQFMRDFVRAGASVAAFTVLSSVTTPAFAQGDCRNNCSQNNIACRNSCSPNDFPCRTQCDNQYRTCIGGC